MLLIPTVATVGLGLRETTAKLSQHGPTLIAENVGRHCVYCDSKLNSSVLSIMMNSRVRLQFSRS